MFGFILFMIIIVTGTPGVGKSVIAKNLAKKLKFDYIDINKFVKDNKVYEGYDNKKRCYVVDVKKLNEALVKEISDKGVVIDGHLSHYLDKKYVDWCVVVKCDLKLLKKRLKKRRYGKEKIRENLDSEIFDVCLSEARELQDRILVVDCKVKDISGFFKK